MFQDCGRVLTSIDLRSFTGLNIERFAHNRQFKSLRSLRSLRSDAALHGPFANGFAILSQMHHSALRRLTECYAPGSALQFVQTVKTV